MTAENSDHGTSTRSLGPHVTRSFGLVAFATSAAWHTAILAPGVALWSREAAWTVSAHACVDAILWCAVFALALRLGRRSRVAALAVFGVWTVYTLAIRTVDYGYFSGGGWHLDGLFLQHAHGDLLDVPLTDDHRYAILGAVVAGLAWLSLFAVALRRGAPRRRALRVWGGAVAVALAIGLLGAVSGLAAPSADPGPRASDHRAWPEWTFPVLLLRGDMRAAPPEATEALSAQGRSAAQALGIRIDAAAEFPLARPAAALAPLPFARTETPRPDRPNVLLIYFEALSAALCSSYPSCEHPGLTPNLDALIREGHLVEGLYNSATPTMAGIASTFASHLSTIDSHDWHAASGKRWKSIFRVFADRGYDTAYLHPVQNSVMRVGDVLRQMGCARVIGRPAVEAALGEKAAGWGLSDDQLFRHYRGLLESGEVAEPFFFSMKTMDTHPPYAPTPGQVPYADGSPRILDAVFNSDRAFGAFWEWFRASRFAANTIVVVTADHAMVPGSEYRAVRQREDTYHRIFDEIVFAVWDPFHANAGRSFVLSTQLDVAPTILHTCGFEESNHFEGRSVFAADRSRTAVAGATSWRGFIAWGEQGAVEVDRFDWSDAVTGPANAPVSRAGLLDLLAWKRGLVARDRMWAEASTVSVDTAALDRLARELADADPTVRRRAAEQLHAMGIAAQSAVPALVGRLADPDPETRIAVSRALAEIGAGAVEALVGLLDDEDPELRFAALMTLGAGGRANRAAAPRLLELLDGDPGPLAVYLVSALVRIAPDDPRVARRVADLLASPDRALRLVLVRGLAPEALFGRAASADVVVEPLAALLADPEARASAAEVLLRIGPRAAAAAPALAAALRAGDRVVICQTLDALGPAAVVAVPVILEVLPTASLVEQRALAATLGVLGDDRPAVLAALRKLSESPDRDVADTASQSLEDLRR